MENTVVRKEKSITVRVDPAIAAAIEDLQERDGITPSEMIRRSLRAWLATKAVLPATKRKAVLRG